MSRPNSATRTKSTTADMSPEERLLYYAGARRVTAGRITQVVNRQLVSAWAGRVRGKFVTDPVSGRFRFKEREEALEAARRFREACRKDVQKLGLPLPPTRRLAGPRP